MVSSFPSSHPQHHSMAGIKKGLTPAGQPTTPQIFNQMNDTSNITHRQQSKPVLIQDIEKELNPEWSKPESLTPPLHPVPDCPLSTLPSVLGNQAMDIAKRLNAPPDFAIIAMLVALATATRGSIQIRPKQYDNWSEYPNLWGAGIGSPSVLKSPTTAEAFKPLNKVQKDFSIQYQASLKQWLDEKKFLDLKMSAAEKKVKSGEMDKEEFMSIQQELSLHESAKPTQRRLIVNDATMEKLGELMIDSPGLLNYRDELLGSLNQYNKPGRETDRAFALEAWKGVNGYMVDRIGRGEQVIPLVLMVMFGTIQPGALREYFSELGSSESGDGLMQRFQLMVYPDKAPFDYVDQKPDNRARDAYYNLIEKVATADFKHYCEIDAYADVPYLHFDTEGQKVFVDWYSDFFGRSIQSYSESELLETHFAKYRKLVPSLALLFHLCDLFTQQTSQKSVSALQVQRAIKFTDYLLEHSKRVYGLFQNAHIGGANTLAERLQSKKLIDGFTVRDVVRKSWKGLTDQRQVERAVNELVSKNWLKEEEIPYSGTGRPQAPTYLVNPLIFAL